MQDGHASSPGRFGDEVLHPEPERPADDGQEQRKELIAELVKAPELPRRNGQFQSERLHESTPSIPTRHLSRQAPGRKYRAMSAVRCELRPRPAACPPG